MRYVTVQVIRSDGRPASQERVSLWIYQFLASGMIDEKYTDTEGEAEFSLDVDESAELSISVGGYEKVKRGPIRGSYRVYL